MNPTTWTIETKLTLIIGFLLMLLVSMTLLADRAMAAL